MGQQAVFQTDHVNVGILEPFATVHCDQRDGIVACFLFFLALAVQRQLLKKFLQSLRGFERGIRAIRGLKNVYADLAGSDPCAGFTEMAVRELGAERVIYGSDAGGRSFSSQLAKVFGANIPESAKKLILGENLKRLMTPILKAKGIKS